MTTLEQVIGQSFGEIELYMSETSVKKFTAHVNELLEERNKPDILLVVPNKKYFVRFGTKFKGVCCIAPSQQIIELNAEEQGKISMEIIKEKVESTVLVAEAFSIQSIIIYSISLL